MWGRGGSTGLLVALGSSGPGVQGWGGPQGQHQSDPWKQGPLWCPLEQRAELPGEWPPIAPRPGHLLARGSSPAAWQGGQASWAWKGQLGLETALAQHPGPHQPWVAAAISSRPPVDQGLEMCGQACPTPPRPSHTSELNDKAESSGLQGQSCM